MDPQLQQLIQSSPFLAPGDKSFLLDRMMRMNPLDRLKIKQALEHGQAPEILAKLQEIRNKFFQIENQQQPAPTAKPVAKRVLSYSILSQPQVLGSAIPQNAPADGVPPLRNLQEFQHPGQLGMLTAQHVSFNINENVEQVMQDFLDRVTQVLVKIEDVTVRRNYFMNYLQSPLFVNYVNTGITALKHPELQPAKIILNTLYQINQQFLNTKQFQHAATISNHVRNLCGL